MGLSNNCCATWIAGRDIVLNSLSTLNGLGSESGGYDEDKTKVTLSERLRETLHFVFQDAD